MEAMGGLLVATALSGVLPLVNAELLVVAAAAVVPGAGILLVAGVATIGQMFSKTILFSLARWLPEKLPRKAGAHVEKASKKVAEYQGAMGSLIFASASVGLPPFYGVSLATGALGTRLSTFLIGGLAGRFLRFGVFAWAGYTFGGGAVEALAELGVPGFMLGN